MVDVMEQVVCAEHLQKLKPDCSNCFGLCCAALYFSKLDGFPADKNAGTPCPHLNGEFRCGIHEKLNESGYKGCIAYECFGAGQQVSQVSYRGCSWRENPSSAETMFRVFFIMQQLYEVDWYLNEAVLYGLAPSFNVLVEEALHQTESATFLPPSSLLEFDLSTYHANIGNLLKEISGSVRKQTSKNLAIDITKRSYVRKDFSGKDLRKKDLRCTDLRGALLIASNLQEMDLRGTDFLGADLRDANLKGADLSNSLFLTQSQMNTAKGNSGTRLPSYLLRPNRWR